MGEVWRAHHATRRDAVAIKVLDPARRPTARAIASIHREVRAIASLDHPGIIRIHDYGELPHAIDAEDIHWNHGAPFFVMEYADGGALHQISHTLSWPEMRKLLLAILEALAHAHSRGVIHRDLKPSNILLRQGSVAIDDLMISDFGLAYALGQEEHELQASKRSRAFLVGTPAYMAPEQIQHALRDLGPWTDLYALGCMAWQLVHGQPPFGLHDSDDQIMRRHLHDSLPAWAPKLRVPDGLHAWMRSLLAKNPYDRFAFASEAARALTLLDHLGEQLPGLSEHERSIPMPERTHFRDAGLGLYELRPVPLVARHKERATLWRTFEEMVASQTPYLVILRGEAGVGKSRLAEWMVERSHERGAALSLSAFHEPNPQATEVLRRMLDKELRVAQLPRRDVEKHIRTYLERWPLLDDTHETLGQDVHILTQVTISPSRQRALSTPPSWQERKATWLRLIRRLTMRKALILWIDDAQWASDLLSLAQAIMEQGERLQLPVYIVATLREEALDGQGIQARQLEQLVAQARDRVRHISLPALEPLEHERLIRELLPLSSTLTDRVAQRTQGNPLFTIQLIGDWVQRGMLHVGPHGLELDELERPGLPEDIHELWRSRIEQVTHASSGRVLRALQAAAVLGRDIMPDEWQHMCTLEGLEIPPDLLDQMVLHRLAITTDAGWCFYHEMLRESLLSMARESGCLRTLHSTAAQMLRERYDLAIPRIAERLAYHDIEAGNHAEALPLLMTSLHHFRVVGELYRAHHVVRHWERAVEQLRLPHGDMMYVEGLLAIVQLHITQGELGEAETQLELTRRHAHMSDELAPRVEVELVRARLLRKRGENTLALEAIEQGMSWLAEAEHSPELRGERDTDEVLATLRARGTMAHGEILASLGHYQEAREHLVEAIAQIKHMDCREELGRGLLALSEVLSHQNQDALSKELLDEAIGQFTRQNNQVALAYCSNFQGDLARRNHQEERAREHYMKARALLVALGSNDAVFPALNLILLALKQAKNEEVMRYVPGVRQAFIEQGREAYTGMVDLAEASWAITHGHMERGEQLARRGMTTIIEAGLVEPDLLFLADNLHHLLLTHSPHHELIDDVASFASNHRNQLEPPDKPSDPAEA